MSYREEAEIAIADLMDKAYSDGRKDGYDEAESLTYHQGYTRGLMTGLVIGLLVGAYCIGLGGA